MGYLTHTFSKVKSFIINSLFTHKNEVSYQSTIGLKIQSKAILFGVISLNVTTFSPLNNIMFGDVRIYSTNSVFEKLIVDDLLIKSYLMILFFSANLESVKFSIYKQSHLLK